MTRGRPHWRNAHLHSHKQFNKQERSTTQLDSSRQTQHASLCSATACTASWLQIPQGFSLLASRVKADEHCKMFKGSRSAFCAGDTGEQTGCACGGLWSAEVQLRIASVPFLSFSRAASSGRESSAVVRQLCATVCLTADHSELQCTNGIQRWRPNGTRRRRARPVCAAYSRGESCCRRGTVVHGQPGDSLPSSDLVRSHSAVACNGGGRVKREDGSTAQEEQCTITGKRVVSKGIWSTTSQSDPFPRTVSLRRDLERHAPLSVFRLVLGHLCTIWPQTSRIVISVMPYLRGNTCGGRLQGSGAVDWWLGKGHSAG